MDDSEYQSYIEGLPNAALYDVLDHLDSTSFPERVRLVESELARRKANSPTPNDVEKGSDPES